MHKSRDYNEIQGKSPHYSYVSPQKGLLYCEQLHGCAGRAGDTTIITNCGRYLVPRLFTKYTSIHWTVRHHDHSKRINVASRINDMRAMEESKEYKSC